VSHLNGVMFNWAAALGAWALGGPLYAVLAFLGVALVRVSLQMQELRRDNDELRRLLDDPARGFRMSGTRQVPTPRPLGAFRPNPARF